MQLVKFMFCLDNTCTLRMGSIFSPSQMHECTGVQVNVQCICWVVVNHNFSSSSHFNTRLITLHMYVILSPLKSELDTQLAICHFVTEMK